ncbi:MAG TPA: glycosyltransferase family 39 protein [Ktedonobacterales bacterium]|nr:glycosyltransferase family 39 protein [Ktedonobacterales bacterium]
MRRLPLPTRPQDDAEATQRIPLQHSADSTVVIAHHRLRSWLAFARRHLPFALILLLATYLITINMTTPWQSMHEDNGTLNESIALNHLRYGLGVTKGQDLLDLEAKQSFGPQGVSEAQHFAYFFKGPVHPQVYGDHPPLLGLTIALSFVVFGFHFWAERLVPILYALAGMILFYTLVRRYFDIGIARFAAFLYATYPMMAYFGRNVSHESPTLFWALVLLTGYFRWRERGERRRWWAALMVVAVVAGGCYGWPLFYFSFLLFGIDWLAHRHADRKLALLTLLPAVIMFVLVIAQIDWALGGTLHSLIGMFLHRFGGGSADISGPLSAIGWFNQVTVWNAEGFGLWSQLALPFVVFFLARRFEAERWSPRMILVALLTAWGISHVLIFRDGAYVHAYWQFYLLPFYALGPAWLCVTMARQHLHLPATRALALSMAGGVAMCLGLASIIALYSTGYHVTLPVTPLFDLWR